VWTKDEVERAEALYKQGVLLKDIGLILGRTKNSVTGKLYRARDKSKHRGAIKKITKVKKFYLGEMPKKGCLWHSEDSGWCGKKVVNGKPYCSIHHERSLLKPQPKLNIEVVIKSINALALR